MDITEVKRIEDMEGTETISDNDMIIVQFDNGGTKKMLYKDLVKEVKKSLGIEKIQEGITVRDFDNYGVELVRADNNGTVKVSMGDQRAFDTLLVGQAGNSKHEICLPFSFGVDAQGNYGYYKVGADTVTPFKSHDVLNPDLQPQDLGLINPPTANIDGAIAYTISSIYDVEGLFFEFYLTSSGIQKYPRNISLIGNYGNINFANADYNEFQILDESTGVKLYTDNQVHQPSSVSNGNSNMMFLCMQDSSAGKYRVLHGLVHITDGEDTVGWWLM